MTNEKEEHLFDGQPTQKSPLCGEIMIAWEESKKGYESLHCKFNDKLLGVWKYTTSDNLSIWSRYIWTVQLSGGEYLGTGEESTLDKACEAAMKEAAI